MPTSNVHTRLVLVALIPELRFIDQTQPKQSQITWPIHRNKNEEPSMPFPVFCGLMEQEEAVVAGHHDHLHDDL